MKLATVIAFCLMLVCSAAHAQKPGPNFTPIAEFPVTGQPDKVSVLYSVEWPPDSVYTLHSHPGDEYGFVTKGAFGIKLIDGPWRTYTTGQAFYVPAGVAHEHKNMTVSTTTLHQFLVEKDKKLLQPYTKS